MGSPPFTAMGAIEDIGSGEALLSSERSDGSYIPVARECSLMLDFALVDLSFLFQALHMKSSRGLNSVSTRFRNHFSKSTSVDLSLRPSIYSYHLTLRRIDTSVVALLRYFGV